MTELYSLVPEPLKVDGLAIKGLLSIFGNIEKNWIHFCLAFEKETDIAPVLVKVFAGSAYYEYLCSPDDGKNTVSSKIFESEFLISQGFSVESVLPLVSNRGNN